MTDRETQKHSSTDVDDVRLSSSVETNVVVVGVPQKGRSDPPLEVPVVPLGTVDDARFDEAKTEHDDVGREYEVHRYVVEYFEPCLVLSVSEKVVSQIRQTLTGFEAIKSKIPKDHVGAIDEDESCDEEDAELRAKGSTFKSKTFLRV